MVINAILITNTILIYTNITLLYMNVVYYNKIKGYFVTRKMMSATNSKTIESLCLPQIRW